MLEIKIVFRNGYIGYYNLIDKELTGSELIEFEDLMRNAIREKVDGTITLKEKLEGYITIISFKEVTTFGTKIVERSN
jgi:hypothetical protein